MIDQNRPERAKPTDVLCARGLYQITCRNAKGDVRWSDIAPNLVTNQGKNAMLSAFFTTSAYSAVWYATLITGGVALTTSIYTAPVVTEVAANVIAGGRVPVLWGAASAGQIQTSTLLFPITNPAIVAGIMIVSGETTIAQVGDTAAQNGVMFSAASFASGAQTVQVGDTLNVTYSISL